MHDVSTRAVAAAGDAGIFAELAQARSLRSKRQLNVHTRFLRWLGSCAALCTFFQLLVSPFSPLLNHTSGGSSPRASS